MEIEIVVISMILFAGICWLARREGRRYRREDLRRSLFGANQWWGQR